MVMGDKIDALKELQKSAQCYKLVKQLDRTFQRTNMPVQDARQDGV